MYLIKMVSDITKNSKLTNLRYLALISIHKIQRFNSFYKNNLILHPQVRNCITKLTFIYNDFAQNEIEWNVIILNLMIFFGFAKVIFSAWLYRKTRPEVVDLICSDSAHCSFPDLLRLWWFSVGICNCEPGYKSHDLL